jgi:hypothetical protein
MFQRFEVEKEREEWADEGLLSSKTSKTVSIFSCSPLLMLIAALGVNSALSVILTGSCRD